MIQAMDWFNQHNNNELSDLVKHAKYEDIKKYKVI